MEEIEEEGDEEGGDIFDRDVPTTHSYCQEATCMNGADCEVHADGTNDT